MFRERLQGLLDRVDGSRSVALVSADGIPVESIMRDREDDLEMLAAETVAQVRGMADNHQEFSLGGVRQLVVETAKQKLVLGRLPEDYYLLMVLGPETPAGRARFELRRAWIDFESDLI